MCVRVRVRVRVCVRGRAWARKRKDAHHHDAFVVGNVAVRERNMSQHHAVCGRPLPGYVLLNMLNLRDATQHRPLRSRR